MLIKTVTVFFQVFISLFVLCQGIPVPEEAAATAPLLLPNGYLGLVAYPYAVPVYPHILHTGVHYPLAQAYVHDDAGDMSDDASPAAEAYAHDVTGDVSDAVAPAAEAYVHDVTGDVADASSPAAEAYVHDTTGDA